MGPLGPVWVRIPPRAPANGHLQAVALDPHKCVHLGSLDVRRMTRSRLVLWPALALALAACTGDESSPVATAGLTLEPAAQADEPDTTSNTAGIVVIALGMVTIGAGAWAYRQAGKGA